MEYFFDVDESFLTLWTLNEFTSFFNKLSEGLLKHLSDELIVAVYCSQERSDLTDIGRAVHLDNCINFGRISAYTFNDLVLTFV